MQEIMTKRPKAIPMYIPTENTNIKLFAQSVSF